MKKNRSAIPAVLMVVGGLLVLGAGIWYGWVVFSQPAVNQQPPTASVPAQAPATAEGYPDVTRVSLADAKAAYDTGQAVFLDVRGENEYAGGHIPGAISIPLQDLPARMGELDSQAWIITYCT